MRTGMVIPNDVNFFNPVMGTYTPEDLSKYTLLN